jgi:hypothetical protein
MSGVGYVLEKNDRISLYENPQRKYGFEKTEIELSVQQRENEREENESMDPFEGVRAQLS